MQKKEIYENIYEKKGYQFKEWNTKSDGSGTRYTDQQYRDAIEAVLKQNGGFIPGVKPGKKTAEYLEGILSKITLPGSIFLAIVAVLPAFVSLLGVNSQFAQFYGGTSLLIMVGVILDTLQQIESHLLMRHYDGLTKTGRIKGRSSLPA